VPLTDLGLDDDVLMDFERDFFQNWCESSV